MKDLSSADLRYRIGVAANHFVFADPDSQRILAWIGWSVLIAKCAFVYGVVIFVCVQDGDPVLARRGFLAVSALLLQVWFLWRVAPAFVPSATPIRRAQLYLPIRQVVIVRRWFNTTRQSAIVCAVVMTAVAGAVVACGVSAIIVSANLLWQLAVLAFAAKTSYLCISHCGRMGWASSIVFWSYAGLSFIGLQAIFVAFEVGFAEFFAGPFFVILLAPQAVAIHLGDAAAFALVAAVLIGCKAYWPAMLSPSWRRLRAISLSWRQLPDRESPQPGHLNYPRAALQVKDLSQGASRSVSRQIRSNIVGPNPNVMVEPEVRRRHRLLAAAIVVAHMSMLTALDVLNLMNLAPAPPSFAVSAIVYHLPAMWGVFQIVPMVRARLVSIGGLVRLGLRGLLSDTAVLALLFLPSLYLIGRMGGDFVTPATHLANCLLIASVLRVAWIPLVAYQCESINASVAMFAGMIGFFVVVMMMGVIRFFFGWAADELMFVVPLWVGGLVLVLGWDRVAARIHPHVPALREIWRRMNAPLGMPGH